MVRGPVPRIQGLQGDLTPRSSGKIGGVLDAFEKNRVGIPTVRAWREITGHQMDPRSIKHLGVVERLSKRPLRVALSARKCCETELSSCGIATRCVDESEGEARLPQPGRYSRRRKVVWDG